jgi:hypothetical protein
MANFGVTPEGFVIKGLDVILAEARQRAQAILPEHQLDLTDTSPLTMLLRVSAAEDAELWKRMEDLYYANFISTAVGDTLNLLGEDLGLSRRNLFAEGETTLTIVNPLPGRTYVFPEGTILITAAPVRAFATLQAVALSELNPGGTVPVRALERGPDGDVAAGAIVGIDPEYQARYLNLGTATVQVTNAKALQRGAELEPDEVYRPRLLGLPRNLWTIAAVERAAADVDGVVDVRTFDPLGGVDVSQSYFNLFNFNDRVYGRERRLGEPYFFDVVVAHEPSRPWRTTGAAAGVYEQVRAAVDRVRPAGIHPNVTQADHIEVGIRAAVIVEPGYDPQGLLASIKQRIAANVGALKLGGDVLASQVTRAFVEQPGVVDIHDLHLRRCPAAFGRITFGDVQFQLDAIEVPVGENLVMGPRDIAFFRIDSDLIDLEVVAR